MKTKNNYQLSSSGFSSMNDSPTSSGQRFLAQGSNVVRVQIPDVALTNSYRQTNLAATMSRTHSNHFDTLQQVSAGAACSSGASLDCGGLNSIADAASVSVPNRLAKDALDFGAKSVDRVVDSILQMFPLNQPATVTFVGCKNEDETDKVTLDVANRLAERRVGKVLLIDSNTITQGLSSELGFGDSEGIGNVVCDRKQWKSLLQLGPTEGLDFLPYGTAKTTKMVRSRAADFLENTKEDYQFICVSVGLNEDAISKSFCRAADGIYLIIDLNQVSHAEAKFAAEKLQAKKQPLVGCIALDAEQESK